MFLTLTAGVWSSALAAVASSWCMHDMGVSEADVAPASGEHDCCRAKLDDANAPHSESSEHAHEAATTHENSSSPEPQADGAHAQMDCALTKEPEAGSRSAAAFGERGRSCFECCAGRANQTPATAAISAPEQNKVKRAAANASACANELFVPGAHGVSHLAPSQHAPPVPRERRHVLISVFLI